MARLADFYALFDHLRRSWDPTEELATHTRSVYTITTYEQHHTGARGPRSMSFEHKRRWLLAVERIHEMDNDWSDIFYHVFVFADGEIWEGRDARRTSQGNIANALTVHIPGNNVQVTEAQYQSLLKVARWVTSNPNNVRDHQQRPAKTYCSGPNGRAVIDRLRQELKTMPIPVELIPQDLGHHEDAVMARHKGFWDGKEPGRVASRSVAAVLANRVDVAAQDRELQLRKLIGRLRADVDALKLQVRVLEARAVKDEVIDLPAIIAAVLPAVRADIAEHLSP